MSTGRNTQITTWRRYTAAERKAYRDRQRRRSGQRQIWINGRAVWVSRWDLQRGTFNFADNLGSRVPTMRVNGERL